LQSREVVDDKCDAGIVTICKNKVPMNDVRELRMGMVWQQKRSCSSEAGTTSHGGFPLLNGAKGQNLIQ
jgi:hypothetical protein